MFDIKLSDCEVTNIYIKDYCGVPQSYITFEFGDGFVFETNCEIAISPIKFHEFILQNFSHLDKIHFCLGFVKKFSNRAITNLEMSNSKLYSKESNKIYCVDMNIHLNSVKINKIKFEYLRDYVQFVTFMFSDGDYIRYEVDLNKYTGNGKEYVEPINFFRYVEMLESCCVQQNNLSKELLFKRIVSKQRFVIKEYRIITGEYIMNCSLNKVNDGVSIFFTKRSIDWQGTFYNACYIEREMPFDVKSVSFSEIKKCSDQTLIID